LSALRRTNPSTSTNSRMDTSCCSLSVKVVFQNSSRLGNKPRCKVPFNQDTAFPSFTAISSDKASFLPNAQYQSLACAASLLTIQTQQENTFARASEVYYLYILGQGKDLLGQQGRPFPEQFYFVGTPRPFPQSWVLAFSEPHSRTADIS